MDMNALVARVKSQREDGTHDEYSFATAERADRFRASLRAQGREVLA